MTVNEIQDQIIDNFTLFEDDMESRLFYLMDLGKKLPAMSDEHKTEEFIVKGCQSKVWLHSELKDGKIFFTADSDATITKGMIYVLIRIFSGRNPKDVANGNLDFVSKIGLMEHISPTRSNGLLSMFKQMQFEAQKSLN